MDHHRIHIREMKHILSFMVKSFLELATMSRSLKQEAWCTCLLESATGSDLISLEKHSWSQADIALLPCSKGLQMCLKAPLLTIISL